jgi:hypothetical protein
MATITTTGRRRFKKRRDGQITPVYEGSIGSYSNIASGVTSIIGGYGIKSTGGTDPTLSFDGTDLNIDEMDSSGAERHTYCLHLELKLRESPLP